MHIPGPVFSLESSLLWVDVLSAEPSRPSNNLGEMGGFRQSVPELWEALRL